MTQAAQAWIALGGGAIAFLVSFYQYVRAQAWRRMEWVASEVKAFQGDPYIKTGLLILDWKERILPMLLDAPEEPPKKTFAYTEDMLDHALRSPSRQQDRDYTDEELVIRDCMDRLMDGLERFEAFIQSGLIKPDELYPFIGYWLDILGDPQNARKSPEARGWINTYINDYRFDGVPRLLNRFKHHW